MNVTSREKALGAITAMVLLYGLLGLLAKGRLETWRLKREEYRQTAGRIAREQALIAQRQQWENQYAGMKGLMPVFPADRPVDTYWLGVMDKAALRHGLSIAKRQVGTEQLVGDACEVAIECKEWEGSLEALVRFLHDLEAEGVMLDVRQMFIRPNPANHAVLRGSFTLFCAYMREKGSERASPAAPRGSVKPRK